jgi:hypothetical protein
MRELTESIVRFYLAVSLLGIKETTNLLAQYKPTESKDELEALTKAVTIKLDSYLEKLFTTGDGLQKSLLDLGFGVVDPATWNLSKFLPGKKCVNNNEEWGPIPPPD